MFFLICVHLCPSVVHSAGRYPDPSGHCRNRNRNRNRYRYRNRYRNRWSA
ncbi:MAG: hypothetical protein ACOX52_17515 [Verrucomicrobiota bacterium]